MRVAYGLPVKGIEELVQLLLQRALVMNPEHPTLLAMLEHAADYGDAKHEIEYLARLYAFGAYAIEETGDTEATPLVRGGLALQSTRKGTELSFRDADRRRYSIVLRWNGTSRASVALPAADVSKVTPGKGIDWPLVRSKW